MIFVNLYQHGKNQAISSICCGEIVDLKILQSDWQKVFWPISQNWPIFHAKIWKNLMIKFQGKTWTDGQKD